MSRRKDSLCKEREDKSASLRVKISTPEKGRTVVGDGVDHLHDELPASHSVRPSARPVVRVLEEQTGVLRVRFPYQFDEGRTEER